MAEGAREVDVDVELAVDEGCGDIVDGLVAALEESGGGVWARVENVWEDGDCVGVSVRAHWRVRKEDGAALAASVTFHSRRRASLPLIYPAGYWLCRAEGSCTPAVPILWEVAVLEGGQWEERSEWSMLGGE